VLRTIKVNVETVTDREGGRGFSGGTESFPKRTLEEVGRRRVTAGGVVRAKIRSDRGWGAQKKIVLAGGGRGVRSRGTKN